MKYRRVEPIDDDAEGAVCCNICCFSYSSQDMFSLSCKHEFCKNCMSDHLGSKVVDG
jgi:hypothetical protein